MRFSTRCGELDTRRGWMASRHAAAPAGHLEEELGDLLFQIVFHAQLAHEAGQFDLWPMSPVGCTTSWCTGTRTSSATRRPPHPIRWSPTGRR